MELFDYLPIAIMVVLGVVFAAASLFLSRLVSPSKPTPEKLAPYESGHLRGFGHRAERGEGAGCPSD